METGLEEEINSLKKARSRSKADMTSTVKKIENSKINQEKSEKKILSVQIKLVNTDTTYDKHKMVRGKDLDEYLEETEEVYTSITAKVRKFRKDTLMNQGAQLMQNIDTYVKQERSVALRLAERQSNQKADGNVRKTVFHSSIDAGSSDYASKPSNCVIHTRNGVKHKTEDSSSEETLKQRNRDLADKVKQLQPKNTQVTRQMQIQAEHLSELERQLNTSESEITEKSRLELSHTKEKLQVHIQTIGILVEEQQTLQKQLSVTQKRSQ
ncbi:rho-associated protein kinase 1-like [Watersipora subatra]|uniref:rho-associated protein kinase 1-like n=1 Tax=Watersipora subatra TaxID=2589382 RepID=UPI00355C8470